MKIYVNAEGVIYDVGENITGDTSLSEIEINDNGNPFSGWSKGKICCYKVAVQDGIVTMMTLAVDSRIIRNFDAVSPKTFTKTAYTGDTEITFYDVPDGNVSVFIGGYSGNYSVNRIQDRLTVSFEPLADQTDITISIS